MPTEAIAIVQQLHQQASLAQQAAQSSLDPGDMHAAKRMTDQAFIAECLVTADRHPLTGKPLALVDRLPPAPASTDPRRAWSGLLRQEQE